VKASEVDQPCGSSRTLRGVASRRSQRPAGASWHIAALRPADLCFHEDGELPRTCGPRLLHSAGSSSMQRLFRRYVGVSPKLLRRYRLHEATERIASGECRDLSDLAYDLG
jgi:hypothetical protein